MSEHRAQIRWKRATSDFDLKTYNREHSWTFPKGGLVVAASAAPEYRGKPEGVDPEEALVASLSSCHMLTFLALASRRNIVVDSMTTRRWACWRRTPKAAWRSRA